MDSQEIHLDNASPKPTVVRGARACTVCRAAKMKCVGADDGQRQCQRCKRANVECVFEKHRRGRKPGSKLSEASKMLRRLEKGLNSAKLKSQSSESPTYSESRDGLSGLARPDNFNGPNTHFPTNELPPLNLPPHAYGSGGPDGYATSSHDSRNMDMDDDEEEEDNDRAADGMFPAKLIRKENQRNSFFRTILNPEHDTATTSHMRGQNGYSSPPQQNLRAAPIPSGLNDPITAGIITDDDAKVLFDMLFLRLNPFINLFDPALHSVAYVRSKCPFLFTTLIMAGCKFFKQDLYKPCQKLAHDFAVRAFAEAWKRVEVVQAFACLTYWKEPDDNRTWTYIGYACRMAVELGLNRYVAKPPAHESQFQLRERRNRERTYLVLFVHDRSLSMQTGRHWMLPEDDLVRHSSTWHEEGGTPIRPEDVIVSAFVNLRRIASETTDMFYTNKGLPTDMFYSNKDLPGTQGNHNDVNYEVVLRNCNGKLTQWMDTWGSEMVKANGESFHMSFLSIFRLHVRLFLNSFGIQASMSPTSRTSPSLQALSACFTSALETLQIVSKEFAQISMLRYSQDSITVMTAYSAVFLLKLLRSSITLASLHAGATDEIHALISKTADAYHEASILSPASTSAAYHARFLRSLVANDRYKAQQHSEKSRSTVPYSNTPAAEPIDPRLQVDTMPPSARTAQQNVHSPHQMYPQPMVESHEYSFSFPATSAPEYVPDQRSVRCDGPMAALPGSTIYANAAPVIPHASELDASYWRNMFLELGYQEGSAEHSPLPSPPAAQPQQDPRNAYMSAPPQHAPPPQHVQQQQQHSYHHMQHPGAQANYGH